MRTGVKGIIIDKHRNILVFCIPLLLLLSLHQTKKSSIKNPCFMYQNNHNNSIPPSTIVKTAIWGVGGIILIIIAMAFIRPWYNVWSQEMEGKAEFAKAEQNRKIKIEEARANLEAEKLNAQAEVERAKGAAEAIRIENGSITPTYIQYLWVRQQSELNDKTVIYVPTETNLPILEGARLLTNSSPQQQ